MMFQTIEILDPTGKPENKESATDATLATHSENGDAQNRLMDEGNGNSDHQILSHELLMLSLVPRPTVNTNRSHS